MSYGYEQYRSISAANPYNSQSSSGFMNHSSFGTMDNQCSYSPLMAQPLQEDQNVTTYGGGSEGYDRGMKRSYSSAMMLQEDMKVTVGNTGHNAGYGQNNNVSYGQNNMGSGRSVRTRLGPRDGTTYQSYNNNYSSGSNQGFNRGNRGGARVGLAGDRSRRVKEIPEKSAAKKHPAQAIRDFFPEHIYDEVTHNSFGKYKNVSVKLTIPSKNNAVFVGTGISFLVKRAQKIARNVAAVNCLKFYAVAGCTDMLDHLNEKDKSAMEELKFESKIEHVGKKLKIEGVTKPVDIASYVLKLYGPGVEYKFDQVCAHPKTIFKCTLTVQGKTFDGVGNNKKEAKEGVTEMCIQVFEKRPPPSVASYKDNVRVEVVTVNKPIAVVDKSVAKAEDKSVVEGTDKSVAEGTDKSVAKTPDKSSAEATDKSDPVKPQVKRVRVRPDKSARAKAWQGKPTPETAEDHLLHMVYKLAKEKTAALGHTFYFMANVAGIVLVDGADEDVNNFKVISVATGKNAIFLKSFKTDGTVVHDSSADILVIRAFRNYLYDELDKAIAGEESILEKNGDKYQLKPQYKLVLAKNQPPLGDCQVYDIVPPGKPQRSKPPSDRSQPGALQYYVAPKDLDAEFNPHNMKVYTDLSIEKQHNLEKHAIASASDKMTVRNIVGIQGALLSQFLEPIYFNKVVFNNFVNEKAINRALFGRIESQIYKVTHPYAINKPTISTSNIELDKPNPKLNQLAYSGWANVNSDWEAIRTSTGFKQGSPKAYPTRKEFPDDVDYYTKKLEIAKELKAALGQSALCKRALLQRFVQVCTKLDIVIPDTYLQCKMQATEYHAVKLKVLNAFITAECGTWPKKTINVDDFNVERDVENVCKD